jgi:small GTP-binding protein
MAATPDQTMSGVFISYRREESSGYAGRIYAWLKEQLDEDQVFMDIEGIGPGEDYAAAIRTRIASSQLVLVIIGPRWVQVTDGRGRPRLKQPDDLVAAEVATAISKGVQVVPVLVGGAAIPNRRDLPRALAELTNRNALEVSDKFFDQSMEALAQHLRKSGISFRPLMSERSKKSEVSQGEPAATVLKYKVCLLGSAGVGKTSLVRRFVSSVFSDSYITTLRVKIDKKIVSVGAFEVNLMIWDLAGEEEGFPVDIRKVRDTSGLILVADGCRLSTLEAALRLQRRICDEIGPRPTSLAVNKVDIYSEWEVSMEMLESYSRIGTAIFTTSAKTGKAVDQLFTHVAREIVAVDLAKPTPE